MIITFDDTCHYLYVKREDDDPKYYNESNLWYAIKNELNAKGFDLVKLDPQNDGHLTSMPYYLKTRSQRSQSPHIYVYDGQYAIRMMYTDFNNGLLSLDVSLDVYGKQPDVIERIRRIMSGQEAV